MHERFHNASAAFFTAHRPDPSTAEVDSPAFHGPRVTQSGKIMRGWWGSESMWMRGRAGIFTARLQPTDCSFAPTTQSQLNHLSNQTVYSTSQHLYQLPLSIRQNVRLGYVLIPQTIGDLPLTPPQAKDKSSTTRSTTRTRVTRTRASSAMSFSLVVPLSAR